MMQGFLRPLAGGSSFLPGRPPWKCGQRRRDKSMKSWIRSGGSAGTPGNEHAHSVVGCPVGWPLADRPRSPLGFGVGGVPPPPPPPPILGGGGGVRCSVAPAPSCMLLARHAQRLQRSSPSNLRPTAALTRHPAPRCEPAAWRACDTRPSRRRPRHPPPPLPRPRARASHLHPASHAQQQRPSQRAGRRGERAPLSGDLDEQKLTCS